MIELVAPADTIAVWLRGLARQRAVFFPQRAGERSFRFEQLTDTAPIDLEHYVPTIVPPGKKMMPAADELVRFRQQGGKVETDARIDTSSRVLAGVRSCDLKAIGLLDKVQSDGVRDPYYLARRDHTAIIAVDCATACDDRAFCQATRALGHKQGADVFLTPVDGKLLVEGLTPRGEELLKGASFEVCKDAAARRDRAEQAKPKTFGRALKAPVDKLPALLRQRYRDALWERHVEKCFSCGTCTMVCPTCYCFDVKDDLGFDLQSGNRVRTWDSCMLPEFAIVAGGHNFRPEAAARQRHRVKRKFEYLMERFGGESFCVGCGRCGRQCTTHIDIYDIVNDVAGGGA
jgi:sulfhydrogenase subunit beta (sulfur reductase)